MSQTWDVTLIPTDPDAPVPYVERRGAPRGEVTVRLKALDGTWEVCGADRARGVWPENVNGIRADQWGSKTVGFDLRRDPKAIWPDIAAFTRVQIDIDGVHRWSGRVAQTPVRDDLDSVISVQCEGMQAHLDDDLYERVYVHTRLSDWKDARSFLDAALGAGAGQLPAAGQVNSDGGLTLMFPRATDGTGDAQYAQVAAVLDLGPGSLAKRVVLTVENSNSHGEYKFFVRGGTSVPSMQANTGEQIVSTQIGLGSGASTVVSGSFSSSYRYVMVLLEPNVNVAYGDADNWFKITSAMVFADTTYESGDASSLTSDDIVLDALDRGTMLLSSDTSQVAAGTFNIPEFAPTEPRTPRQMWEAADAFEDRLRQIDLQDRAVYKAKPTAPVVEVGAWSAMSFEDASANDGSEVYSRVIVKGTQPDGTPLRVERTQAQQTGIAGDQPASPAFLNPSFITNANDWTAQLGAVVRDTTNYDSGTAGGKLDPVGTEYFYTALSGTFLAGVTYRVTFRYRTNVAATFTGVDKRFARLGVLGTDEASMSWDDTTCDTTWRTATIVWTPSESRTGVTLRVQTPNLSGADYMNFDTFVLEVMRPTIVERQGFRRTKVLDVSFTLTRLSAARLGDKFLEAHQRTPFKGTVKLTGHGAVRDILTGMPLPVDALLGMTGEMIRFTDRIDPDTGAVGRDARIAEVSIDPDTEEATVTLDNSRAGFDALLARLDVVLGQNQSR